jgi:hypothetical protein
MFEVNSSGGQIVLGMVANLLCIAATGLLGIALINPWVGGRLRRPLRRFFGLHNDRKRSRLQIKLSNINVLPKGTVSVTPITFGFIGSTISEAEYVHALKLAGIVNSKPLHRALRSLAQENGLPIAEPPVFCDISVSPGYEDVPGLSLDHGREGVDPGWKERMRDDIKRMFDRGGTYVLAGSPVYNVLVDYVLHHFPESRFEFTRHLEGRHGTGEERYDRAVTFRRRIPEHLVRREHLDAPEPHYVEYFVIQKFRRTDPNELTIFVCAGTCIAATAAALDMLADWPTLRKQFGDEPFAALYELKTSKRELSSYDHEQPPDVWDIELRHAQRESGYANVPWPAVDDDSSSMASADRNPGTA